MSTIASRYLLAVAALGAVAASSAFAQPAIRIAQLRAVDRAGNALVTVNGREIREETTLLLDASGRLAYCRTDALPTVFQPRTDADGFLFLSLDAPGQSSLQRWDARGVVEWVHRFESRPDFSGRPGLVSAPDGGAVVIEEYHAPGYLNEAQMLRLGPDGSERWRTSLFAYGNGFAAYSLGVDRYQRVQFAVSAHRSPLALNSPGTVRLGLVGADGRLAWMHEETHGAFAQSVLFSDGDGDFWWYLSAHGWPAVPYRPSQLARWTSWGMPLVSFDGPAMVPGSEIVLPAMDRRGAVWYLAYGPREIELVRLGTTGREARHVIDARVESPSGMNFGLYYETSLSVGADAAWIAVSRPGNSGGSHVERYTRAGRAWTRRLGGQESVIRLTALETGDARLLSALARDEYSLANLSARDGEETWRISLGAAYAACEAR